MAMVSAVRKCRSVPRHKLLHPRHIKETAEVLDSISRSAANDRHHDRPAIHMGHTSLNVRLSASPVGTNIFSYAISYRNSVMDEETARTLLGLITRLRHCASAEFLTGSKGVFHLLARPSFDEFCTPRPDTEIAPVRDSC
jgi:hypothetical protein